MTDKLTEILSKRSTEEGLPESLLNDIVQIFKKNPSNSKPELKNKTKQIQEIILRHSSDS